MLRKLMRAGRAIDVDSSPEAFTAVFPTEAALTAAGLSPGQSPSGLTVTALGRSVFRVDALDANKSQGARQSAQKSGAKVFSVYRSTGAGGADQNEYVVTDQIVVAFGEGVGTGDIDALLERYKLQIMKQYPRLERTYLLRVTGDDHPLEVSERLSKEGGVRYAEPNLVTEHHTFHDPIDTQYEKQWHLKATTDVELVAGADVDAPEAWDIERGSREVVVAVIDDGFDLNHSDFKGPGKVVFAKDYVDGDANPFPNTGDYHGTPCAGVAIAEENGYGVVGIAPGCAFMPVRFPLSASDDALIEIFDYVGHRADVISCSWGPGPGYAPLSSALADKLQQLGDTGGPRGKGTVIVFAAGNYNAPLDDPNPNGHRWFHYGSNSVVTTRGPILNGWTVHPAVIAVAASTSQNKKSTYSNWGRHVSVCAPSNNFDPIDPRNVRRPGRGIWTTDNENFGDDFTPQSDVTGSFGGTSSATPLVAGVAALVISQNRELTAKQVRMVLETTTDKITDASTDVYLGHKKGTYDANGRCDWFGHGKVNAKKAVEMAKSMLPTPAAAVTELSASAAGTLNATGATQTFKVHVGGTLTFKLEGPAGKDFDLYVRRGEPPTISTYDAIGYTSSANEEITVPATGPGDYYVMVRSYDGQGPFKLSARLT